MNSFDMYLHMFTATKWFAANFTFEIFGFFMHDFDMLLHMITSAKRFVAKFTFEVFDFLMDAFNMFLQNCTVTECLSTNFTFKVSDFFMHLFDVPAECPLILENFVAIVTITNWQFRCCVDNFAVFFQTFWIIKCFTAWIASETFLWCFCVFHTRESVHVQTHCCFTMEKAGCMTVQALS